METEAWPACYATVVKCSTFTGADNAFEDHVVPVYYPGGRSVAWIIALWIMIFWKRMRNPGPRVGVRASFVSISNSQGR